MFFGKKNPLKKVRKDIKQHGWHLILIEGNQQPGFCYTIGLWETYAHPELMIFAPKADPCGYAFAIQALVARIQKGEKVLAGSPQAGLFGQYDGAIRSVLPAYFSPFLGTAANYYGHHDFKALQIFWPDKQGSFPWQDGFQEDLLRAQPNLWQSNLILAGMSPNDLAHLIKEEPELFQQSFESLFLKLTPDQLEDIAQILQPLIQEPQSALKVSIFGDVAFQQKDGGICWFDSGYAEWDRLPTDQGPWEQFVSLFPTIFFHQNLMLTLNHIDMELESGQVYSWTLPPALGGEDSVNNLSFVDVFVHLKHVASLNISQS